MKASKASVASIKLAAVGLLSSVMAAVGITGYWAWNSLRGEPEYAPIALSQATIVTPIAPIAPPDPVVTASTAALPAANLATAPAISPAAVPQPTTASPPIWTAPENDYLFDLSRALQPIEYQRLSSAEQLEIARQIQQWVQSGENFWSIRQRFDASYGRSLLGDYAHNREVYIRFATERFAPDYLATLIAPVPFAAPYSQQPVQPYNDPPPGYWIPEVDTYAPNPYASLEPSDEWQRANQMPQLYQQPYQQPVQPQSPDPNLVEAAIR